MRGGSARSSFAPSFRMPGPRSSTSWYTNRSSPGPTNRSAASSPPSTPPSPSPISLSRKSAITRKGSSPWTRSDEPPWRRLSNSPDFPGPRRGRQDRRLRRRRSRARRCTAAPWKKPWSRRCRPTATTALTRPSNSTRTSRHAPETEIRALIYNHRGMALFALGRPGEAVGIFPGRSITTASICGHAATAA